MIAINPHDNTYSDATLAYYEENAHAFVEGTATADMSDAMARFTSLLPQGGTVLDWGCGSGRDARALYDAGFEVCASDASPAMCEMARELFGIEAACERFDELCADNAFDGIWACASLLHLEMAALPETFETAWRALKDGGVLYSSFKLGCYEGMRGGRWYTDLNAYELESLLSPLFDIIEIWISDDVRGGDFPQWVNCLARKRSR